MTRASALNVLAMTRSAELGERINPMFAALDGNATRDVVPLKAPDVAVPPANGPAPPRVTLV